MRRVGAIIGSGLRRIGVVYVDDKSNQSDGRKIDTHLKTCEKLKRRIGSFNDEQCFCTTDFFRR